MKQVSKAAMQSEQTEGQLRKEIQVHSALSHPNIIGFYGVFADRTHVFLLLEFASGAAVFGELKADVRLEESRARGIVLEVNRAVAHLHRDKILHRDIKPENVLMQFGTVKLCDFGWATPCDSMCDSYCGTPLYLSPEMVQRRLYSQPVDIWALGVLAYELVVGRPPFKVWSEFELAKIVDDQLEFPPYVDCSEDFRSFVGECLAKNPYSRPSATTLLLHPFYRGQA